MQPEAPRPLSGKEFAHLLQVGATEADLPRLVETVRRMLDVSVALQDASKTNEKLLAGLANQNGGAIRLDKLSILSLPKEYAVLIEEDQAKSFVTIFVKEMGPTILLAK